jgi:hypothetical protein
MPSLRQGGVGVALSGLYQFFDELDLAERHGAPPRSAYLPRLRDQLEFVEQDVRDNHAGEAEVARNPGELQSALDAGKTALVHCVEGGFHWEPRPGRLTLPSPSWQDAASPKSCCRTSCTGGWRPTPRRCRSCRTSSRRDGLRPRRVHQGRPASSRCPTCPGSRLRYASRYGADAELICSENAAAAPPVVARTGP